MGVSPPCPAAIAVVRRDLDIDDFGVARAQAAQFIAYGTGLVLVIEPLLARMVSRPRSISAGIPAGNPRISSGSKCDAVGHYEVPVLLLLRLNIADPR